MTRSQAATATMKRRRLIGDHAFNSLYIVGASKKPAVYNRSGVRLKNAGLRGRWPTASWTAGCSMNAQCRLVARAAGRCVGELADHHLTALIYFAALNYMATFGNGAKKRSS